MPFLICLGTCVWFLECTFASCVFRRTHLNQWSWNTLGWMVLTGDWRRWIFWENFTSWIKMKLFHGLCSVNMNRVCRTFSWVLEIMRSKIFNSSHFFFICYICSYYGKLLVNISSIKLLDLEVLRKLDFEVQASFGPQVRSMTLCFLDFSTEAGQHSLLLFLSWFHYPG